MLVRTTNIPRLRHLAERLHALGPRPLFEFLVEVAAGADLVDRLERYADLDPDVVHRLGADRMPPSHRVVGGGRAPRNQFSPW
jgi:hypothetical protein